MWGDCIKVSTSSSKLESQGSIPCHPDFKFYINLFEKVVF